MEEHPELPKYGHVYYMKNKEKMNANSREWERNNRERAKEINRRNQLKPKAKEIRKAWREKNPEKMRAYRQKSDKARYTVPGRLLNRYKGCARRREIEWSMQDEEAKSMFGERCHYCGETPCNGIDRKDSNIGYKIENTLPCCGICNRAKHEMAYDDFIKYLRRVSVFWNRQKEELLE